MGNKNYVNGRNREYRLMKKLQSQDYYTIRSSGSHSIADIVAIKKGEVRFIQSKMNGYMAPEERAEKKRLEAQLGIVIEVM